MSSEQFVAGTEILPSLTGPVPETLAISRFSAPATTSVKPLRQELSWPELVALLSTHERRTDKDGRGWSFATYRKGTTRRNNTVEATAGLGGDVDHATFENYEAIVARLEELGLAYVIYSTFTNEPPDNVRFRVAIPFTKKITGDTTITALEQYRLIWTRANHHIFGGRLDVQAKDLSRMLYLPAAPEGAAVFVKVSDGLALDWQALPAAPAAAKHQTNSTGHHTGEIKQIGRAAAEFIAFGAPLKQQRGRALAAGRNLLAAGYSVEDTAAKLWQGFQNSPSDLTEPWTEADALQIATSLANSEPTPPQKLEGVILAVPTTRIKPAQPSNPALRTNGTNGTVHHGEVEPPAEPPNATENPTEQQPRSFALTDLGNSERLVAQFGQDLRYCHVWSKWLYWDGKRWREDTVGRVYRLAKKVVRSIYQEASEAGSDAARKELAKHAIRSEGRERIKAMVELAQSELPIEPGDLDTNHWLLNVRNGTLDLRTGKLREHQRGDSITKLIDVAYDAAAECPLWLAFLERVLPDEMLRHFMKRASGYSATGSARERCVLIPHGSGKNGKGVFLQTLRLVLSEYAVRTPSETFMAKRSDAIPNDIAQLRGARFVFASETNEGRRLAEATLKDLTGGEDISARFMRGEWFSFAPTFTPWLATNHRPMIRGSDPAIWDRVRLIPFTVRIPDEEQDPELTEKLKAEFPGILTWIVQGAVEWHRDGLGVPSAVRDATANYQSEMDLLGAFIADRCVIDPQSWGLANALYKSYCEWSASNGERPLTSTAFGIRLMERGFTRTRLGPKQARTWSGLRLLGNDEVAQTGSGTQTGSDTVLGITGREFISRGDDLKNVSEPVYGDNRSEDDEFATTRPRRDRLSSCWRCKESEVASRSNFECGTCGWLICSCGACSSDCEAQHEGQSDEEKFGDV